MAEYILARGNGRHIPHEDKIFGISNRAKAMIAEKGADKVINATIGSLLDDDGNLVVLSSVDEVFKHLSPAEYADYAPIGGIKPFPGKNIRFSGKRYHIIWIQTSIGISVCQNGFVGQIIFCRLLVKEFSRIGHGMNAGDLKFGHRLK